MSKITIVFVLIALFGCQSTDETWEPQDKSQIYYGMIFNNVYKYISEMPYDSKVDLYHSINGDYDFNRIASCLSEDDAKAIGELNRGSRADFCSMYPDTVPDILVMFDAVSNGVRVALEEFVAASEPGDF